MLLSAIGYAGAQHALGGEAHAERLAHLWNMLEELERGCPDICN